VDTYGCNLNVVGYLRIDFAVTNWNYTPVRISDVRNPAGVYLLGDGVYQLNPPYNYIFFDGASNIGYWYDFATDALVRWSHDGVPLGVFVDGHVEARRGPWPNSLSGP
jgi:hypothetical protein